MAATVTAGAVMDRAAVYLNDPTRSVYTYAVLIPYLNGALQTLQEYFELHGIATTQKTSALINVTAGTTKIGYATVPALPSDLITPVQVWEKREGTDGYVPIAKRSFLPHNLEGIDTSYFGIYTWNGQELEFLPSTVDIDIKIDYIKELFAQIVASADIITLVNARTYLEFKTAAGAARYIMENKSRADDLDIEAELAKDVAAGINIKGKQSIVTRRRPLRNSRRW
jgi:hypothetical protein